MENIGSNGTSSRGGDHPGNLTGSDLEKQGNIPVLPQEERQPGLVGDSAYEANPTLLTIFVTNGDSHVTQQPIAKLSKGVESDKEELPCATSPKKGYFSRTTSSHEQCRVCQQGKEEGLIDLGCQCKGGLAKAHQSCIDTWFRTKGSNKCEICQVVAVNVTAPAPEHCVCFNFNPLWVALLILIGGILLTVLKSITPGVAALLVKILIGVMAILGLGFVLLLALEFCQESSCRRAVQRVETNATLGYHPAL